jgi:hypothetical protein
MLKVGTIVSIISTSDPYNGIVVPLTDAYGRWQSPNVSMVLITSSGEYQGKVYPFQKHQLEIISDSS